MALDDTPDGRAIIVITIAVPVIAIVGWLNRKSYQRAANKSLYCDPTICRPATGWFFFSLLAGVAGLIGGIVGSIYWGSGRGNIYRPWLATLFAIGDAVIGILIIIGTLKSRVILDKDSITLVGVRKNKTLRRDEIVAKRFVAGGGMTYVTLYPRTRKQKKIMIAFWYDQNQKIRDWVANIPGISKEHHPPSLDWIYRLKEKMRLRRDQSKGNSG